MAAPTNKRFCRCCCHVVTSSLSVSTLSKELTMPSG